VILCPYNISEVENVKRVCKMCTKFYGECVFPITIIDQWKKLVGKKKWKPEKSACKLANAWFNEQVNKQDIPQEIKGVLKNRFENVRMQFASVEHKVYLDTKRAPSCSDIMIYAKANKKHLIIAVEGKDNEGFDKPVKNWLKLRKEGGNRLKFLCEIMNLKTNEVREIKYQLLHRASSAILEARKNGYENAILLVHSFSQKNNHFENFQDFGKIMGIKAKIKLNTLYLSKKIENINFYMLWFNSNCKEWKVYE